VRASLGHSAATLAEARDGYAAGAPTTTHVFNAMSGIDHRAPGLALAALLDDAVYVELIADGIHVDPGLWPLIRRLKPADRLVLVGDAAGSGDPISGEGMSVAFACARALGDLLPKALARGADRAALAQLRAERGEAHLGRGSGGGAAGGPREPQPAPDRSRHPEGPGPAARAARRRPP
jgi:hypothetical protein